MATTCRSKISASRWTCSSAVQLPARGRWIRPCAGAFAKCTEGAHYAPLRRLDLGATRMYLGLIDPIDAVDGALQRVAGARRHLPDFGLATACGWGRRPLNDSVEALLRLERDVIDKLASIPAHNPYQPEA